MYRTNNGVIHGKEGADDMALIAGVIGIVVIAVVVVIAAVAAIVAGVKDSLQDE